MVCSSMESVSVQPRLKKRNSLCVVPLSWNRILELLRMNPSRLLAVGGKLPLTLMWSDSKQERSPLPTPQTQYYLGSPALTICFFKSPPHKAKPPDKCHLGLWRLQAGFAECHIISEWYPFKKIPQLGRMSYSTKLETPEVGNLRLWGLSLFVLRLHILI